ncbi:MAG: hypothetical protein DA408_09760 [Bacteroidetes bacterium]|nr:MAG: hypothetical protein C7N36_05585 [Bacteroidota bacterium]PTM12684.1 MAG: hypothetical protein DA408_09760 [Bacteroidota bacterium]
MVIRSTFIGLTKVLDKFDDLAIEAAVAGIHFPPAIESEYNKLVVTVIARGDDVYPEQHYRIEKTLYVSLQFDPEQLLPLSTAAVTRLVRDRTENYLAATGEVEEREMQQIDF